MVANSSAARNGLLIEHQLIEVNGQCVVGMKVSTIHIFYIKFTIHCILSTMYFVYSTTALNTSSTLHKFKQFLKMLPVRNANFFVFMFSFSSTETAFLTLFLGNLIWKQLEHENYFISWMLQVTQCRLQCLFQGIF